VAGGVTVNVTVSGQPGVVHRPHTPHHQHSPLATTGLDVSAVFVLATTIVAAAAGLNRWRHRTGAEDA
jgi:hypothetical protein